MFAFSIECATICFIIQILSKPFLVKYFGEILSFDNIGILFSTTDSYLAQNFAHPEKTPGIFPALFTLSDTIWDIFKTGKQRDYLHMVEISQFVCAVYSLKNCLWVQGGYLLVLGGYLGG